MAWITKRKRSDDGVSATVVWPGDELISEIIDTALTGGTIRPKVGC